MAGLDANSDGSRSLGPTARLAEFVSDLQYKQLPCHVVERAKDLLLDHIGVALHSIALPWSQIVRRLAANEQGKGEASLYAGATVPLRSAVLANATTAHGIELDDTHDESLSHPGAVVIPPALALMQRDQIHGRDVLLAVVAGYDVQCRVGSAAGKRLYLDGFHPTSTNGVFGATAAAGKLLGLSTAQMQSAFGLALSMASGAMQFSQDPVGTMVKRLHAGLPAERGVLAAQLAREGFMGPAEAFEGKYGFLRIFAHHDETERLTRRLGESFEIEQISVKLYACCRLFHALIDAIEECRLEKSFGPDDVRSVTALGPKMMYEQHMEYTPDSVMSAQYSLPYTVAAALLFDPKDPAAFGKDHFSRADVRALATKTRAEHDGGLEALCPQKFPAGVRVELLDGTVVERTVPDSRGTPIRPLDRAGVIDKFRTLTHRVVTPAEQEAIVNAALGLDEDSGATRLGDLLSAVRPMNMGG